MGHVDLFVNKPTIVFISFLFHIFFLFFSFFFFFFDLLLVLICKERWCLINPLFLSCRKEPLDDLTYTVNYNRPGMCILNHGSNVLHHVTPITHNPKNIVRMSVIMAFSSANAYRPNELVIHTMTFCDAHSKLWGYEYFRYSAWQMMTVLKDMVENQKQVDDDQTYADHLRQVADELTRVAHQIENPHIDEIKYYHEDNAGLSSDHYERAKLQQIANLKNMNLKENTIAANVSLLKRVMAETSTSTSTSTSTDHSGAWRSVAEADHPDVEEHFALR